MNDFASCKEHTLNCHNPSASDSYCREKSGPWCLSCFDSSGSETDASWTPSAAGVLEGDPEGNKELWIQRLKFPNGDLSDPTVQAPIVCTAGKQLQFTKTEILFVEIWFDVLFLPIKQNAPGQRELFLHSFKKIPFYEILEEVFHGDSHHFFEPIGSKCLSRSQRSIELRFYLLVNKCISYHCTLNKARCRCSKSMGPGNHGPWLVVSHYIG